MNYNLINMVQIKDLLSIELGVINFTNKYPDNLVKCLSKYYNIEDSSISFYFPYIEYFSQEDTLIDYESRFNNSHTLVDIIDNIQVFDEYNTKYIGIVNKNNHEFTTPIVIKRMPILNFEDIILLKIHIKKSNINMLQPSQPIVPFAKLASFYNSTYIETMVSYMINKLCESDICPHYPLFFGYCIFNEQDAIYNITDDIEKLDGYSWFSENESQKFYKKYNYTIVYKPSDNNTNLTEDESVDSDNDGETYAIVNHAPVQLKFAEYCGEDNIKGRISFNEKEWESILFQIIYALYVNWSYFQLTHNDLHLGNVLFKPTNETHLYYKIQGKYYKIPTYGYIVKINDWNRATFNLNGTFFKNDCFDRDGDCYGQFIFPETYYYCKNPILPNQHTDLALLASSIINEDNIPHNSKIYELVRGWCTNKYGVCIPEKYNDFDMYKESSKCENSDPEKLFNTPIFSQYRINKELIHVSKTIYNMIYDI
jgi:hypothetical protein